MLQYTMLQCYIVENPSNREKFKISTLLTNSPGVPTNKRKLHSENKLMVLSLTSLTDQKGSSIQLMLYNSLKYFVAVADFIRRIVLNV